MRNGEQALRRNLILALIFLAAAVFSATFFAEKMASPGTHAHSIEELDEKKNDVMELAGAATATSVTITLLPGDTATPVADKLADLSQYLLIVLCAIYLEKYLVVVMGIVAFRVLIPIGLLLLIFSIFWLSRRSQLWYAGLRLIGLGLALFLVIPASIWISDRIETTYQASIDSTLEAVENATEGINPDQQESETGPDGEQQAGTEAQGGEEDSRSLWDKIRGIPSTLSESASEAVAGVTQVSEEKLKELENVLSRFMESIAVMIITSCVIPILVLAFFFFVIRILVGNNSQVIVLPPEQAGREGGMRRAGNHPRTRRAHVDDAET
ncbi:MAG: hypothetical protein Q4D81_02390 [Eubacteriales bacterium]|nr:hypothetical protein [Eubacteriales bacterium]